MKDAEPGFRPRTQQLDEIDFRNEQDGGFFHRARMSRVAALCRQRRLGERFDRLEKMNHLLLPRGTFAVNVDSAALHDIKTFRWRAFMK